MIDYYRVFGLSETTPDVAALVQHLQVEGLTAVPHFRGDDLGWTGGELLFGDQYVTVERFLTKEDDLRDQLNTWAGWLETRTNQPRHAELMQRVIGTKQLFALQPAPGVVLHQLRAKISQWLARQTNGIYQADGCGFFASDGTMLLPEDEPPGKP